MQSISAACWPFASRFDLTCLNLALAITEAGESGHVGQVNLHFLSPSGIAYHQRLVGVLSVEVCTSCCLRLWHRNQGGSGRSCLSGP